MPHPGLYRHPHRARRQHLAAIGVGLGGKQFHTGHRDHAGADAVRLQQVAGFQRNLNLGPRGHQDHLPFAAGLGQHIAALRRQVAGGMFGAHRRQVLPAQRQHGGGGFGGQRQFPRLGGFHRIGGAEDMGVGGGPADRQMLDRLVGRPILAQPDAVVGHHEHRRYPHQRRQPHRRAGIVGKAHEGAAIGPRAAMQRHAVHRRRHPMFADAKIDIAASPMFRQENSQIRGLGVV